MPSAPYLGQASISGRMPGRPHSNGPGVQSDVVVITTGFRSGERRPDLSTANDPSRKIEAGIDDNHLTGHCLSVRHTSLLSLAARASEIGRRQLYAIPHLRPLSPQIGTSSTVLGTGADEETIRDRIDYAD